MEQIENPWLYHQEKETEFILYCHNPDCTSFNQEQVVPGIYETDTGWGEPDWDTCRDCGEELVSWSPE